MNKFNPNTKNEILNGVIKILDEYDLKIPYSDDPYINRLEVAKLINKLYASKLQEVERAAYQNAADNFGYLSQSDGDLIEEAKSLHEHFTELAQLKGEHHE